MINAPSAFTRNVFLQFLYTSMEIVLKLIHLSGDGSSKVGVVFSHAAKLLVPSLEAATRRLETDPPAKGTKDLTCLSGTPRFPGAKSIIADPRPRRSRLMPCSRSYGYVRRYVYKTFWLMISG